MRFEEVVFDYVRQVLIGHRIRPERSGLLGNVVPGRSVQGECVDAERELIAPEPGVRVPRAKSLSQIDRAFCRSPELAAWLPGNPIVVESPEQRILSLRQCGKAVVRHIPTLPL